MTNPNEPIAEDVEFYDTLHGSDAHRPHRAPVAPQGLVMETFTVDTRDVFTVHKAGCGHLNFLKSSDAQGFDIEAEPTREAIYAQLEEYDTGTGIEDMVGFAPCLQALPTR